MAWPAVADVREKLGDRYASDPADSVIQSFLDRRKSEVQESTGQEWSDPPKAVFKWVLNYACADVLFREITGKDLGTPLKYKLGDLSSDKDPNVQAKVRLILALQERAELELEDYLGRITYLSGSGESAFYQRGSA